MRICLLIGVGVLIVCTSLSGQNSRSQADPTAVVEPSANQSEADNGRYVSGFEVLNQGKDPEALGFYAIRTLETIRSKWYPQIPALQKSVGRKQGAAVIEFEVGRNGSLRNITTVKSAGDASLDNAAAEAISSSAPFSPLPEKYHEKALQLKIYFGYDQPGSAEAPFCDGPNWGAHPGAYELHKIGQDVTPPKTTYDREPEYSEQARRAKYSSVVHVAGTVDPQGAFTDLCVSESAGNGLDEKAMEAVKTWKFEPAMLRGEPVATRINVEVSFQLY
jgi:TonB family protein